MALFIFDILEIDDNCNVRNWNGATGSDKILIILIQLFGRVTMK